MLTRLLHRWEEWYDFSLADDIGKHTKRSFGHLLQGDVFTVWPTNDKYGFKLADYDPLTQLATQRSRSQLVAAVCKHLEYKDRLVISWLWVTGSQMELNYG